MRFAAVVGAEPGKVGQALGDMMSINVLMRLLPRAWKPQVSGRLARCVIAGRQ